MTLSPRLAAYALGVVVCIIALIAVVSFLSDPFGIRSWWNGLQADRQAQVASNGEARTIESEGRAGQLDRLETHYREVITIQSATEPFAAEARSAPDADTPLDLERADRLRRADDSLCLHTAGCSPSTDNPAG